MQLEKQGGENKLGTLKTYKSVEGLEKERKPADPEERIGVHPVIGF